MINDQDNWWRPGRLVFRSVFVTIRRPLSIHLTVATLYADCFSATIEGHAATSNNQFNRERSISGVNVGLDDRHTNHDLAPDISRHPAPSVILHPSEPIDERHKALTWAALAVFFFLLSLNLFLFLLLTKRRNKRRLLSHQRQFMEATSKSKLTEGKRRTAERLMSNIINFLPDPTFVIDPESKVIAWNRAMEELTGVKAESMLGKGNYEYALPFYGVRRPVMIDLVSHWDDEEAKGYINVERRGKILVSETSDNHPLLREEEAFMDRSGVTHWLAVTKLPCDPNDFGEPAIVGLAAGMAHEIDNPLAGILQNAAVLERRQRPGNEGIHPAPHLRTVFYHQTGWQGHGSGPIGIVFHYY